MVQTPPERGPKRFFPYFIGLGLAEGMSRAQQKHIEGSETLKRRGRADRSSQNTGPGRVSRIKDGQGRVGGTELISNGCSCKRQIQDVVPFVSRDRELEERASMAGEHGRVGWRLRPEK